MALETNVQVSRLRRFQPLHSDSAELVYEQSDPTEKVFATRALAFVQQVVDDPSVRLIVLTGDAGHGKTSVCAHLLVSLGHSAEAAARLIRDLGDGKQTLATTASGRPLRVLRDLSELRDGPAGVLLEQLLDPSDSGVSVICANEGRLRRVVASHQGQALRVLTETLERGLEDGSLSSVDDGVQVINLNYQSVAPEEHRGLVEWAIFDWGADRRRWGICAKCDAAPICPILANHRALAEDGVGARRRLAIRELFSTAERTGAVITTRMALATIGYAITGGLQCSDVHRRWQRGPQDRGWQYPHLFHQALFGEALTRTKRLHLPALAALRRLDPGSTALREVDDVLEPSSGDDDFIPPAPIVDEGGPRSRRDAQRESEILRRLMRFLRRRVFFENDGNGPSLIRRMGLQAGDDFQHAARNGVSGSVEIRDRLLRGLEAVQGVHRTGQPADFLILDPAFVTHRSRAAVIAQRVSSRRVEILSQRSHWHRAGDRLPELPAALDWLDRSAFVTIATNDLRVAIQLDLMRFELLYRWADGLSSRAQHESEIRHFTNSLAQLVPLGELGDEITVLVNGERRTLTIDVGDRVRSGEG